MKRDDLFLFYLRYLIVLSIICYIKKNSAPKKMSFFFFFFRTKETYYLEINLIVRGLSM